MFKNFQFLIFCIIFKFKNFFFIFIKFLKFVFLILKSKGLKKEIQFTKYYLQNVHTIAIVLTKYDIQL